MAKTFGDYVKIGSRVWNVRIIEITESFNILDTENAGRVIEKGRMALDRIGTFYGHKITFARDKASIAEYDELFNYLARPRNNGIPVTMVHGQDTINYEAYVSAGERKLKRIRLQDEVVEWETFQANFIPMEAQETP